jgi:hypothetical protein
MLSLGAILSAGITRQQGEFNNTNPVLSIAESEVADTLQSATYAKFNAALNKYKKNGGDIKDADILELRIWAPNLQCAMISTHDQLMKEYGIFFSMLVSSGLQLICPGKLYYVALLIRKMGDLQ